MKAAVWPIRDTRNMPMLHGVKMDVVDVAREIGIIANYMLPITTLPDALLAFGNFTIRPRLGIDPTGKSALDEAPAASKVSVIFRQSPESMDVIGQNTNSNRLEGTPFLNGAIDLSQSIHLFDKQLAGPVSEHDREKEHTTFYMSTTIVGHNLS